MSPQFRSTTSSPSSPASPRPFLSGIMSTSNGKEWATAVADSPVRHAIINKPFSLLKMRTESLLDTITGGTLPSIVHETERRQKEADRQLKCRGCKVLFGDEKGLIRHHDLFPAHINPPEHKKKPKRRTSRRSHSTSDMLSSQSSSRVVTRHIRAETMATPETDNVDAPLPIESLPEFKQQAGITRRSRPSRPLPQIPIQQTSDTLDGQPTPLYDFTRTTQATNTIPGAIPLLPALDFGSFKLIGQETGNGPVHARPITKSFETNAFEEKNRAAGAASAFKIVARLDEQHRPIRNASESALDTMTMPTSLQKAARAIIATGKAGPSESAVFETTFTSKTQAMYSALSSEDEVKAPAVPHKPSTNWSILKTPLVATPDKKEQSKARTLSPVATGLTSFSEQEDSSPKSSSPTSTFSRMRPRRNTNPFLNEAFMNNLPNSKSPPLSPYSNSPTSRLPYLNPFTRSPDGPVTFDNVNDEEDYFYNASNTPGEINSTLHPSNPFFYKESNKTNNIISYLPRSESAPMLTTQANNSKSSRNVHFDAKTALTASDSLRCPSCHRAFIDLQSVLSHVDESDCSPFNLSEGQAIHAK